MSWEVLTAGPRHKPRLQLRRGFWMCVSSYAVGFGKTALQAYQDWQRQQYTPKRR